MSIIHSTARVIVTAAIAAPIAVFAASTGSATPNTQAATQSSNDTTISASERTKINTMIHDYLLAHPEDILAAVSKYQQDQKRKQQQAMFDSAISNANDLRTMTFQTVAGNPNGSITLVEFFDYQCVMCWRAYKGVEKLMDKNKNLRVVFRFLPIFGKASIYAAKVYLAAAKQGKYATFHDNMFKAKRIEGKLKNTDVKRIAKKSGVRLNHATRKMINGKMGKAFIAENMKLARALQISGTPAFYIMPTTGKVTKTNLFVFAGAVPATYLQHAIDIVSGKKPHPSTVAAKQAKK